MIYFERAAALRKSALNVDIAEEIPCKAARAFAIYADVGSQPDAMHADARGSSTDKPPHALAMVSGRLAKHTIGVICAVITKYSVALGDIARAIHAGATATLTEAGHAVAAAAFHYQPAVYRVGCANTDIAGRRNDYSI